MTTTITVEKVQHLVVDSGAFIRGAILQDLGDNVYTTQQVVDEIKDQATLQRLQCLPYDLVIKDPPPEDVAAVIEFSRKTGDYHCLSAVDIRLIALARYLERVHVGVDHLKREPSRGVVTGKSPRSGGSSNLSGFYRPMTSIRDKKNSQEEKSGEVILEPSNTEGKESAITDDEKQGENNQENQEPQGVCDDEHDNDNVISGEEEYEDEDEEGEDDDEDDNKGWITPGNLDQVKKAFMAMGIVDDKTPRPPVALITTDFAVQNVVLQMGLKLVSVDGGSVIKQTRQFVLRCFACFKITNDLGRKFCPSCGNLRTLKRVSVSVDDRGKKVIHINFKKPINVRGTKYSLPTPRGGKHSNNPVLVEDQPIPQHKASKFAVDEKKYAANQMIGDQDYAIRSSPFAINDVYSRASRHRNLPGRTNASNFVGPNRNPNVTRRSTGNRKKKSTNQLP